MSGTTPSFTNDVTLSEARLSDASKPADGRKKRVIVTGGSGRLGRWVVREMVEHGWEVFNREYPLFLFPGRG